MATVPLMIPTNCDVERGGKSSLLDDFCYKNNVASAQLHIRMGFLRKVYGLLSIQLFFTTVVAAVALMVPAVRYYIHNNTWMLSLAFLSSIGLLIALHIKRKDHPANLILLATFTVVEAYTIGVVVSYYDQLVVLQAFVLTAAVTVGLTAYTFQTKRDFSAFGAVMFSGLCILMIGGFLQVLLTSTVFELGLSIGGALLFSLFIIFDTQMLMKKVSPEEYILATINLYLDILNLFLYILRILEAIRRH